jgi:chromosome partitioning protein
MKVVSFIGKKGGVGKTINAHAAAHGLSMRGIPTAYVLTDQRPLLSDENRVYTIIDGRTVAQLETAIATTRKASGAGILVLDGGGNRGPVDALLASVSDLIILPFSADDESVFMVDDELAEFSEAFALPTDWPTNRQAMLVDQGYIDKLAAKHPGRILPAAPTTHSVRDLKLENFSGMLLPPAQRYCRLLARHIVQLLDADAEQEAARVA